MQSRIGSRHFATYGDTGHIKTNLLPGRPRWGDDGSVSCILVEGLSRREQEILQLLNQGPSNRAIAVSAYISVNTVKYHLKNLYAKLGVGSRFAAICRAQRLGLV